MKPYHNSTTLEIIECEIMGCMGVLPLGYKQVSKQYVEMAYAVADGRILAHDILEHPSGFDGIGPVQDELQALGATWYIRGQFGDYAKEPTQYRDGDHYDTLSRDVSNMVRDYLYTDKDDQPNVSVWVMTQYDGTYESIDNIQWWNHPDLEQHLFGDDIGEVLHRCTVDKLQAELDQDSTVSQIDVLKYLEHVRENLTTGIDKAIERYQGDALLGNNLFWMMADTTDKEIFKEELNQGMQYHMDYGWDENGECYCRVDSVYDIEEDTAEEIEYDMQ